MQKHARHRAMAAPRFFEHRIQYLNTDAQRAKRMSTPRLRLVGIKTSPALAPGHTEGGRCNYARGANIELSLVSDISCLLDYLTYLNNRRNLYEKCLKPVTIQDLLVGQSKRRCIRAHSRRFHIRRTFTFLFRFHGQSVDVTVLSITDVFSRHG